MRVPEPKSRAGGRSARVRAAVLQATTKVLAETGYGRLSIDEVADRAGVHKTTIYRRWRTKPDLVLDALHSRSDLVIELPHTDDLESDLLVFLRSVAANVASPLGGALVIATIRTGEEAGETAVVRRRFWTSASTGPARDWSGQRTRAMSPRTSTRRSR